MYRVYSGRVAVINYQTRRAWHAWSSQVMIHNQLHNINCSSVMHKANQFSLFSLSILPQTCMSYVLYAMQHNNV